MADQDFNIKVITTADTSGIRQTDKALQDLRDKQKQDAGAAALFARIPPGGIIPPAVAEKSGSDIGEHIGRGFERVAIHAIGIGAVLGAIDEIKKVTEEINKITEALDKQGQLLVENSRQMITQSKFAKDDADVLKIAEEGMKAIAAQHKIVTDLQEKGLGKYEKAADLIQQIDPTTTGSKGANQARLDEQRAQALSNEQAQRRTSIAAVRAAEQEKERVATLSTAEAIGELNKKIADEQALQSKHYQDGDIQGYVESSQAIQQYRKQLELATAANQKQQEAIYGAASPQAKAILENEKRARETGDQAFQKTADQLRASASASDLAQVQAVADSYGKAARPGRAAGVGESQDLVDQMERQRIAAENAQKPTAQSSGEQGRGGPSMTGEAAAAARHQESMTIWQEMLGVWRGN